MQPLYEAERSFGRSCRENSTNPLIQINVSKILVVCEMIIIIIIIIINIAEQERRKK
jgi:hypothetical protein